MINKLYNETDVKNKEIEDLKDSIRVLRKQVSCLIKDGIEKNNEIWNLKRAIEALEEAKRTLITCPCCDYRFIR